jgi:hypothetical protein
MFTFIYDKAKTFIHIELTNAFVFFFYFKTVSSFQIFSMSVWEVYVENNGVFQCHLVNGVKM